MKKNLLKIIFAIVVFIIALQVAFLIVFKLYPRIFKTLEVAFIDYNKEIIANKADIDDPKVLFLGNSLMISAVVTKNIPDALMLGSTLFTTIEQYFLLKEYLDKHKAPEILVISPTYHYNINVNPYDLVFWKLHVALDLFSWRELLEIYKSCIHVTHCPMIYNSFEYFFNILAYKWNLFYKYIYELQINLFSDINYKYYKYVYEALKKQKGHFIVKNDFFDQFNWRLQKQKDDTFKVYIPSKIHDEFLKKIIKLAESKKMRVVFFPMPLPLPKRNGEYLASTYFKNYVEHLQPLICENKRNKCWTELRYYPKIFYTDRRHLGYEGSMRFTNYILRRLNTLPEFHY